MPARNFGTGTNVDLNVARIAVVLPRVAAGIAFLAAALLVAGAFTGQLLALLFALVPLAAAIGILRKRAWSAYGFSIFLFAQLIPLALTVFRAGQPQSYGVLFASGAVVMILAAFYLWTGRTLDQAAPARGRPVPWLIVAALGSLPLFFVQPFVIPTSAMEDSLLIGDHIMVQRFPRPAIVRDELLVFTYPADRRQTFIKRVIGVPGDRIHISSKIVYRNGHALDEPYAVHKTAYLDTYRDNFPGDSEGPMGVHSRDMLSKHVTNGEVLVPPGFYFVLGDNRDNSLDSRYWGFVPASDVIGRPLLIYQSVAAPASGRPGIRWARVGKLL